jgi:hypothetical protein
LRFPAECGLQACFRTRSVHLEPVFQHLGFGLPPRNGSPSEIPRIKPSPLSWVTPPGSAPGHSDWLDPDLVRSKLLAIGGILRHHEDIYFRNGLCEASDWMVVAREHDVLVILHEPWQPYDRSKVKATFFCASAVHQAAVVDGLPADEHKACFIIPGIEELCRERFLAGFQCQLMNPAHAVDVDDKL